MPYAGVNMPYKTIYVSDDDLSLKPMDERCHTNRLKAGPR